MAPRTLTTDATGGFSITGLPRAPFVVSAEPAGEVRVDVLPGHVAVVEIHVPQPATVEGRVTAAGQPVRGVRVFLRQGLMRGARDTTSESGAFTLRWYGSGTLDLAVDVPGGSSPDPVPVLLSLGATTTVDVTIGSAVLAGRVVEWREGPPGRSLGIRAESQEHRALTRTDEEGRFRFQHLFAGSYRLSVQSPAHGLCVLDVGDVGEGGVREGLVLELGRSAPTASLKGSVRAATGVPVMDGTYVRADRIADGQEEKPSIYVGTTRSGAYSIGDMKPGLYEVTVGRFVQQDWTRTREVLVRDSVSLAGGEERVLDLVLPER